MLKDPTFTLKITKKALKECEKRFNEVIKLIKQSIKTSEISRFINNAEKFMDNKFQYTTSQEYIDAFLLWLEKTMQEAIFDNITEAEQLWLNTYIKDAYSRGITLSQAAIENAAPALGIEAQIGVISLTQNVAQRLLISQHLERTQIIYSRVYEALKGIDRDMANNIRNILTDGIFAGKAPDKLAEDMVKRVNITLNRAKLIARTEIIRANHEAVIADADATADAFRALGTETKFKWRAGQDDRVRPTHKARHDKIYSRQEIGSLIGEPNCRCSIFPVYEDIKNEKILPNQ